ncbi:MAG: FAD-dependent oxidoreductase [Actinomycetota bacterium]|nr:FAD-dependent oxidoreductase [Actinomycetota bacterium]
MKQVVIIGGVAGGMSAATRLRRLDPSASIIVVERSGYVSYANCGLPYFMGGVIANRGDLLLQTPESLHARFRLDVRVLTEVADIDRTAKTVTVRNLADASIYELPYDYLIMSPGAQAIVPNLPGIERALTLRTIEDVTRLSQAVSSSPRHAVVIGGGFIGVETAENLVHRGISTTLVEAMDQVLAPLDPEMAKPVADELSAHGISVRLGSGLSAIDEQGVVLADESRIDADLVILAIGVRPDTALASAAGLEVGPRGGIVVDAFNRTSDPSIYAVGDAVEKTDALDGEAVLVPLANIANRQGRMVADHIMGRPVREVPTIGTAIVKVFDLAVATTGWSEKRLRAQGRACVVLHSHPGSHAGYYPGSESMMLKMVVDPVTGQILGAQGVGRQGVDKRIDVLATAMRAGITAPELADLELAYAPPFGSAKDPVNMLGYMADNVLSGLTQTVQWNELASQMQHGAVLVDVRTPEEFRQGHIPEAINIPVDDLRDRCQQLPKQNVIVYCKVGQRGHTAANLLRECGVASMNLDGGFETWSHSPAARK